MVHNFKCAPSFKAWAPTDEELQKLTRNNKYYKARAALSEPININNLIGSVNAVNPVTFSVKMTKQINITIEKENSFSLIREEAVQLLAKMEKEGIYNLDDEKRCIICDIDKMERHLVSTYQKELEVAKNVRNFVLRTDNYRHCKLCQKHRPFDATESVPKCTGYPTGTVPNASSFSYQKVPKPVKYPQRPEPTFAYMYPLPKCFDYAYNASKFARCNMRMHADMSAQNASYRDVQTLSQKSPNNLSKAAAYTQNNNSYCSDCTGFDVCQCSLTPPSNLPQDLKLKHSKFAHDRIPMPKFYERTQEVSSNRMRTDSDAVNKNFAMRFISNTIPVDYQENSYLANWFNYLTHPNYQPKRMPYTKMFKNDNENVAFYANKKMAAKFPNLSGTSLY